MEIFALLKVLGSAAMVYCGAIFLFSAGMFFFDRSPARKESLQPVRSSERREKDHEDRRAA